jgi:hypothetical protein
VGKIRINTKDRLAMTIVVFLAICLVGMCAIQMYEASHGIDLAVIYSVRDFAAPIVIHTVHFT